MTVVYTKSGSRYLLDEQAMTVSGAHHTLLLVEWPEITVGKSMRLIVKKHADSAERTMTTSEVIGIV